VTKTSIFDEIVQIMKTDAACCKDEPGADPEIYRSKISDDMDDETFLFVVKAYLATFHVMSHVGFGMRGRGSLPFLVQRYQDILYVRAVAKNSELAVGDYITKINGSSVLEFASLHEDMLYGESEERQTYAWGQLLSFAKEVTVVSRDNGEVRTHPITLNGDWSDEIRYTCKQLREDITLLRLKDFQDEEALQKLYADNDALLRNSKYLVIDVRNNAGGSDTAFLPLLKFCLPEDKTLQDLKPGIYDGEIEINYTERSCDSRLKVFTEYLKADIPEEIRSLVQTMVDEMIKNRGKGFVTDHSGDVELPMVGLTTPQKVYVITDQRCGSSGDAFVDMLRKSDKVTVVGRPTSGILDYSNCTEVDYGQFYLIYPTSRSLYLDRNVQMRTHGVPVDLYIPWTPEHLVRDVDLDHVMHLINRE